jgi:hypothetical protein
MPIGWGAIPFGDILGAMADCYRGLFIMELRSRYFPHTCESRRNLKKILALLVERRAPRGASEFPKFS